MQPKLKHYLLLVLSLLIVYSCDETSPESEPLHELAGSTWRFEFRDLNNANILTQLDLSFNADSTFSQVTSVYGGYSGFSSNDLAARVTHEGQVGINGVELTFVVERHTWLDHFYNDPGPHEAEFRGRLWDNCRYSMRGDTLQFDYLSYPADAPVATVRKFIRLR